MVNENYENILNKYSETWDRTKKVIGKDFDVEVIQKTNFMLSIFSNTSWLCLQT